MGRGRVRARRRAVLGREEAAVRLRVILLAGAIALFQVLVGINVSAGL